MMNVSADHCPEKEAKRQPWNGARRAENQMHLLLGAARRKWVLEPGSRQDWAKALFESQELLLGCLPLGSENLPLSKKHIFRFFEFQLLFLEAKRAFINDKTPMPTQALSRELIRSPAAMQHLGQSQIPRWVCLFSVLSVPIVIMEGVNFKGSGRYPSPCIRTHTGAHGHNLRWYGHSSEDTYSADHSLEGLGVRGQAEGTSSVFSAGRNDGD